MSAEMVATDRDTRTVSGRRNDIRRGIESERLRWEAVIGEMIAARRARIAQLEREIAQMQAEKAREMADV